jgi:hypothetical protein
MLDQLTIDSFQPHVGTSFWLTTDGHKVELRLTDAIHRRVPQVALINDVASPLIFSAEADRGSRVPRRSVP